MSTSPLLLFALPCWTTCIFYFLEALICDRLLFVLPSPVFEVQVASPPPVCPSLIDNFGTFDRNLKAPLRNIFVLPGEVLGVQVPSSCLPSPDRQRGHEPM